MLRGFSGRCTKSNERVACDTGLLTKKSILHYENSIDTRVRRTSVAAHGYIGDHSHPAADGSNVSCPVPMLKQTYWLMNEKQNSSSSFARSPLPRTTTDDLNDAESLRYCSLDLSQSECAFSIIQQQTLLYNTIKDSRSSDETINSHSIPHVPEE